MNPTTPTPAAARLPTRPFHGATYLYSVRRGQAAEIGVTTGLGGIWIVGWIKHTGAKARVKTASLPAGKDPAALQKALDAWAQKRALPRIA